MNTVDLFIGGIILAVLIIIVVIIFVAWPKSASTNRPTEAVIPGTGYEANPGLMSTTDVILYIYLVHIFDGTALICPKLRLADIIQPKAHTGGVDWRPALNKIIRKNLDFVCLNADDFSIFGVIEIDRSSEESDKPMVQFEQLRSTLKSAGIRLSVIQSAQEYDYEALYKQILADFELSGETALPAESAAPEIV